MDNELIARVKAVNAVHKYATWLYPELIEALTPFLQKRVVKDDRGLLKRVSDKLPSLPNADGLGVMVYQNRSAYSLSWSVKTCEQVIGADHCLYYEVSVYIGNLRDGVLTGWIEPCERRSDYTVEEIENARARYRELKKAADDAELALSPFGP